MSRFDALYRKYCKDNYKYNKSLTYEENQHKLQEIACQKFACEAIYDKLESTWGEEYAEEVTSLILDGSFTVTQLSRYPFKEYRYAFNRVMLCRFINLVVFKRSYNTLMTFYSNAMIEIISAIKNGGEIELYDFFLCIGLLIEKWRVTEYPKYLTKRKADVEQVLKQFVKVFVNSLYSKKGDRQPITLVILDKTLFQKCMSTGDYSVELDRMTGERLKLDYDMYLDGIRMFMDIVKNTINNKEKYLQPHVRTYCFSTNRVRQDIIKYLARIVGVHFGVINDVFKYVNFDAMPQCLQDPEYKRAFKVLEGMNKTRKKDINWLSVKAHIEMLFATDYKNYLKTCNKKLAYLLQTYDVEKTLTSYETVFFKKEFEVLETNSHNAISEVIINAEYVTKDCQSKEEFEQRLYKAVLDAQAINQMRTSLLNLRPDQTTECLNVKVQGLEDDLISTAYTVLAKATKYLKSTYSMSFSFNITQRMFFRDKDRVCYLTM